MDRPPPSRFLIGTAGWSLPLAEAPRFPGDGSHLERYAAIFRAAEINSSFHRRHRPSTYARWSAAVPVHFRFSAKLPKEITHRSRLLGTEKLVESFIDEVGPLGEKLGCLLIQLPPSLEFDATLARRFFRHLHRVTPAPLACEPRHATWFTKQADDLLAGLRVARVAADPAKVPAGADPGGSPDLTYFRLHGSPRVYYSQYPAAYLDILAVRLRAAAACGNPVWCIFDNTTLGAATPNARELGERLGQFAP